LGEKKYRFKNKIPQILNYSYLFDEDDALLFEEECPLAPPTPLTFFVPSIPFTWASNASNKLLGAYLSKY
jgi:hypothetical protein